jgi:ribonuclease Y
VELFLYIGPIFGLLVGWFISRFFGATSLKSLEEKKQEIIDDAKSDIEDLKNETRLKLTEENETYKIQLEKEFQSRNNSLKSFERTLNEKDASLSKKDSKLSRLDSELSSKKLSINNELKRIEESKSYYRNLVNKANLQMEKIAGMSKEEVLAELKENLISEAREYTNKIISDMFTEAKKTAERKAKDIILQSINQTATEQSAESTVSAIILPDDSMKGRIIGREGRNIRSFELTTGVDVLIDDTPKTIMLSCFDPMRKEIAKISLERLIEDGRIHPGRIEDVVEKVRSEMDDMNYEAGENALFELGLHEIHSELTSLIGKLRFRTGDGQNILKYSLEVAKISSLLANSLELDNHLAKRAAILHQVGRVIDKVDISVKDRTLEALKKYGEKQIIIDIIEGIDCHSETKHPVSIVVEAAKLISESRPGAKREAYEEFSKRLTALEEIAVSFEGVEEAFAIQAGREIRVMIDYDKLSDESSELMAAQIAKKIEDELDYPGQIKVTLFREFRATDYAK